MTERILLKPGGFAAAAGPFPRYRATVLAAPRDPPGRSSEFVLAAAPAPGAGFPRQTDTGGAFPKGSGLCCDESDNPLERAPARSCAALAAAAAISISRILAVGIVDKLHSILHRNHLGHVADVRKDSCF
jgi:hypothetical protein